MGAVKPRMIDADMLIVHLRGFASATEDDNRKDTLEWVIGRVDKMAKKDQSGMWRNPGSEEQGGEE